jgi:hypothetical protein
MELLPDNWADIQAETVYTTTDNLSVSFAIEQIKLGIKYDQKGKHLKAINKGEVPSQGNIGLELKNHQVWQNLAEFIDKLDVKTLATKHLKECDYKISGYWDSEDNYYEEITLPSSLESELISTSIGFEQQKRFLKFKFFLKHHHISSMDKSNNNTVKIGELVVIYDENLEFIDENWILDLNSPLLSVKLG